MVDSIAYFTVFTLEPRCWLLETAMLISDGLPVLMRQQSVILLICEQAVAVHEKLVDLGRTFLYPQRPAILSIDLHGANELC